MSISVTWHGHATFSLNINGTHIVVDPFFVGNNPAAKTSADVVEADFILQTHGHGDHMPTRWGWPSVPGPPSSLILRFATGLGRRGTTRFTP